jgi:UDP-N-acetylmuramoyl-tripeptide--D-alanyl-D-alanine ligase
VRLQEIEFSGVSIDSRSIKAGELFVAISGEKYDGHDFVEEAFLQGAVVAIVSTTFFNKHASMSKKLIPVEDTLLALRDLAESYRNSWLLQVVALTGSSGKTSTKEMIASILRERYRVFVTPGNQNNHLGVPLSILKCDRHNEVAVFELGANHIGEIRENACLVKPNVALITNVGSAHIGEFGGEKAIFSEKSEIFTALSSSGVAIYNVDDSCAGQWEKMLAERNQPTITFGLNEKANIRATDIQYDEFMCAKFILHAFQETTPIKLSVPGLHSIFNALAAVAISMIFELSLENIVTGLEKYAGFSGRMTSKKGMNSSRVIDDSYNANLDSVKAAIHVLSGFSGKRFLVLGDIAELGDWSVEQHRLVGKIAAESDIDGLFTCGKFSQYTGEAFELFNQQHEKAHKLHEHFSDAKVLSEKLIEHLDSQTTVLVKGSRSSHMENVVSAITLV